MASTRQASNAKRLVQKTIKAHKRRGYADGGAPDAPPDVVPPPPAGNPYPTAFDARQQRLASQGLKPDFGTKTTDLPTQMIGNMAKDTATLVPRFMDSVQEANEHTFGPGPSTMSTDEAPWQDRSPALAAQTAMTLAGQGMGAAEEGAAGMFGGKLMKTADAQARSKAIRMETRGEDIDDIHDKTGLTKGADGQWRQEINDRNSKLKLTGFDRETLDDGSPSGFYSPKPTSTPLSDAFHHPEAYEAYPGLKSATLNPMPEAWKDKGYLGAQLGNKIYLADGLTSDQARSVLLHEMQHWVQDTENFARGDSAGVHLPQGFEEHTTNFKQAQAATEREIADQIGTNDYGVETMKNILKKQLHGTDFAEPLGPGHAKVFNDILDKNPEVKRKLTTIVEGEKLIDDTEQDAFSKYNRAMGEVKSRNVEKRRNLTPEQRKDVMPETTEDVPRFLQRNTTPMKAGGGALSFDDLLPGAQPAADATPAAQPAGGALTFDDLAQTPAEPAHATTSFDYVSPTISKAVQNIPSSAMQFGKNMVQPFIHPVDTATGIKNLGLGVLEKTGVVAGKDHEKYADAVGQFFKQRYGSVDAARKTLEEDPVGMAGDVSMLLTGGGGLAARLPGLAGKVGEVASTVGRTIDPMRAVGAVAAPAASVAGQAASHALGVTTGVGEQPFNIAARAGYEGGQAADAFRDSMTGRVPMADVVDQARDAVRQLRQERGAAYRAGMTGVKADNTVLDFNDINQAITKAQGIQTFKGQSLSPSTHDIRGEMRHVINEWETFDPAEFHTPEGIDALKQKLGDIRDKTQFGTPERLAADTIYKAVRQTIVDQVPAYARVMKGYEQASTQIKNIERELSLNPNANVDTALRKLQSVLRDNVNTSFGRRRELANYLVNAGAPNLLEHLAGQALHSWAPRGIVRMGAVETVPAAVGAIAAGAPGAGLAALGTLPTMSPRLMGAAAYGAGAGARYARPIARPAAATLRPARVYGEATNNPYAP